MKKLKRLTAIVLATVSCFSMVGCAQSSGGDADISLSGNTINLSGKAPVVSEKVTPVEFDSFAVRGLDENVFPIGGFFGPCDDYFGNGYKLPSLINDSVFKKLSDCGINYLVDFKNDINKKAENAQNVLELAQKYGISMFMPYEDIMSLQSISTIKYGTPEQMAAAIEPLLEYESFAGLYGRDEPSAIYYPHIKQAVANFREATDLIGDKANDLSVYINLFPKTSGVQLSGEASKPISYKEYVEGFFDCNPYYMMFDMYPISGIEDTVNGEWLKYLAEMNNYSKQNGCAWQGYAQAGGNFFDVPDQHRITNKNELFYDVNTMLAFGAKGISYFPACFPTSYVDIAPEDRINDNSLINKYGATTPIYYYAQEINANIQVMAPVLLNSAHLGVMLNGLGACVYNGNDKFDSFRQLKSISGDPSLVGCFDYNGGTALLVVNNTLTEHRGEITLSFDNNYEYTVIQRATTNYVIAEEFTLTLEAGECALVVVK